MLISQSDNRICIKLTSKDMTELDITYDELDYSKIETRRVLWTLLDEARHELGRNIQLTQKMVIEAIPDNNGGCTIYFTVNDEKSAENGKRHIFKTCTRIICETDNIDNIGSMSKVLSSTNKISKSELFTDGTSYRMIIRPKIPFTDNIEALISEFCDICDDSIAAYTYENWKLIASPDAIGVLWALSD